MSAATTHHVTVILPFYNAAQTLERAIKSVLQQSYGDWDLLLIDDGSTDDSRSVAYRYAAADRRVTLIELKPNRGLPAALNVGWRASRGGLIARMDADDVCYVNRLECQVEFLRINQSIAVVGSAATFVDRNGTVLGIVQRQSTHKTIRTRILVENPFIHPSVLARREFYELLDGYDERLTSGAEDYDLWLRGCDKFLYANIASTLLIYTATPLRFRAALACARVALDHSIRRGLYVAAVWFALRPILGWIAIGLHLRTPNRSGWCSA